MATEEEARGAAADGEEVQVEAVDLGTPHLQMNLDSKLSAHGMKDEAKIMDSTEGMLKVTEDQVLEKTPSVVEIPPEHTPNGTASSLNGHMKEGEISNENPQENGQKANKQAEASPDGIRTDQNNRSNGEEAVDSLGHVESSTEDTSLLTDENEEPKEHYQQDVESATVEEETVHEDTVETDEPTVDAQQGQNLEPAEVTEDTQHTSTSCIPHDEVVAEAPAGVQTSLEPNVDDSGALPDASDGNTETEPAKVDKESCTEDADTAEHANEIIKLEDQPSKQTDDVDAELVKEDVPTSKKTDVPEAMTKAEQADESMSPSDQEELNQESAEETIDPVCERTEETSHGSNVSASEKTTPEHDATAREPALDVQEVQSQGLAEEIADAKEVDSEKTVQQSGVAFEEATQEHNVATIEPSSDIQHLDNVESEEIKGLEDAKAEDASNESNVIIPEDAAQDKEATEDIQPVQGLEEEPKSTGTVEVEEASNQPHADVLNNHAEEDGVPACPHQVKDTGVTETQEITQQSHAAASEELVTEDKSMAVDSRNDDIQKTLEQGSVKVKDTEASETQEICHERTISASEEDSAEDDVTAIGPTSDAQEVEIVESVEEIKDNTADNIVEASNVATVEEADQEHNVLTSDDVSEQQTREVEPEEIQSTEHVETEEASDERHPALLKDPTQEDSIPSDMLKTESTEEAKETEATKTEVLPQESNISTSEEPASEENITASEITCDAQEVENSEQAEDVEDNKDTGTKDISGHSNENNLEEMATEDNITIQTDASIQQLQEQEPVELRDTEATELQGISPSHIVSTSRESTPEDNVTAELSPDSQAENLESATVTEETKDVRSTDAVAEEETPEERIQEFEAPVHTPSAEEPVLEETKNTDNQMDAAVLENTTHEDNPTASDLLVMESAEVSISEATEGQEMPQSEVTQSEDHETEENTTASEPKVLEPEAAEEMRDTEPTEPQSISQESIVSISEESVPEDVTAKGPASDTKEVQTEEPELIDEHNDVKAGEISNQSSGSIVGETAQENLESSTVTEESRDVISTEAIAEETPEEHIQEFEATVDIPPVEETEQEETKNTEPVEVHDNVAINGQPAEEVKNTEATEIAEIHNESGDLNEDVKSNVSLADKAAPDEYAEATEALEETKNSEPVEVENNTIARDLPEEEIKDTEAMETEVIPDESTGAKITEFTNDALAEEEAPEELVIETEATSDIPRAQEPELEEIKNAEPAEVEGNISATEQSAEEIEATDTTEAEAINESINVNTSKLTEDVTTKEAASDIKEVQTEEPELVDEHNDVKAGEISNHSSVSIVGETAQANLESATVSEETKEVKSTDAIAEEETPEKHVQEFVAPVDIPAVEEPELEETKNTEPVSVHDNVMTNDLPAEEVKDTQATETTEIHNESGHLTEDVKSNVVLSDEASPDEDAEATEATADIPRAQDSEQEQIKNNEPVEVEDNIIARDLPEEEIKATEAMETEVIPDESTSAKITELTNDALAEEAAPEELVIETEATIDIPRAQEPELEEIKNAEPAELEENISSTDRSAEEIEASDTTEAEAINGSINANTSELTEDVRAKEAASDIKEVQTEEPELIDEHTDVKDGEISNQSSRTIVGVTAQENLESAAVTEETEDVKITDAIAEEETPVEHVQEFEAPVDTAPVEEPELEEAKNTEHVSVHDNVMTNDLPAEEVKDTQATQIAEIHNESGNLTEDVNSNVVLLDEAAPGEDVEATEATADIPQAQDPEQEQIKNNESVEVEDDIIARDLPEEEIKDTEAMETEAIPDESTSAKVTELTNDVKSNVARAEETAPEEHGIETEATIDIPRAQEPELEETKNSEPLEVDEDMSATDQSAEETKATEAMETEAINESIDANSSKLTDDVKRNSLEYEAAYEEHAIAAETTVNIPRAQEPELEEIKNTEPVEVKENIPASDLPAEEVKETEVIAESTDANISEPTEDVKRNVALADEADSKDHVIAPEATVDVPRAQEPELEEIENAEHVEVEENISANDLPAEENFTENEPQTTGIEPTRPEPTPHESNITIQQLQEQEPDEFCDTEATEPQGIAPPHIASTSEEFTPEDNVATEPSPDTQAEDSESAVVTEKTKDVKSIDGIPEEETPEEHVQELETPVDIPPVEEPELEETKNTEPVEVHDNVATNDLPAEEVKNTEATEIAQIHNESGDPTEDVKSNVAFADDAAPDEDAKATEETADIPQAQEPELEEIKNSEPVEVKENISGSDLPAEEVEETEVISETTDANITEDANRNVAVADEAAPEEHVIATEATVDIPRAQEPEIEENENAEHVEVEENISANDLPPEEVKDTVIMETQAIKESTDANISGLTEDVALADEAVPDVHVDISSAQEPAVEEINNTKPVEVEDSITADDVPAEEINDTEAMETEEIPHENTDDSLTASAPLADMQQAQEESSEQGSDPDLLVQSEDSKDQLVKAEKTGQSNGATLEEPTAEDNAPNETDPLADAKEDHGVESVEGNKGIEADEGEETSHPSQDAEEPVSESIVATIEPTSDIQQVNDLDEAKEMTVTEAIDDEETSCKKTEVATLEGLSPTDNGTSPKQKDESSVLGEKTALTTQKGESPAEEDVQISGEDTVGISNNIEQIKEQSKAVTEADTIKSDEHTSDQGDEQLQNVELQMQVCERSVDVSAIEQPDKDAKKIHLDQQQKEDEAIEEQTEEIQGNEQKHDESSTDLTTETQLEPQSNEIGTTDLNQDTDEFEAEQTETVATEMLMNEQTLHVPQGSIPSTADVKVENSTEIEETPEQEKAPNNIGTLYTDADAENYNEDEKEKIEIDAAVAKPSTDELDGTPDETINEEVGNGLASPVKKDLQKTSDPAPSNEEILENDTTVVPENVEPRVHREERESINKANDDMEASQASEEEIVDDVEKKQERKNEDTDVNNDGVQTKPVGEEASELHSNDSTDTKMDDTMSPYAEMVHGRIDAQPTETEEVEDNNGFSSISEYVVEYPKQNDVEQDLVVHPKVVDDKLATAEQNGAEVETNSDEETATSYTAVTEAVKFDEAIDNKASGADGALSDENVETFEENRSNLEASSVVTASGESKNEDREQHNLALPAYSAVDGNTTEQASGSEVTERGLLFPEKPLPNESEEHEESQTTKEQDEDIHGQETGDTEKEDKEDEQSDLPVSNFLMNLIMGKESTQPDGNLEFEAEKKQEEITKDDGCLITSQHEESLVPVHTENKVDNKLIFEQGKHNLEGSEEIHDFKMESDEVLSRNTHNLEAPVCEKNVQGEVSSELVPGGHGLMTEVETRDIKLGEKTTNSEERRLKNDLDDSTNPKVSQENTLEEGRTDLQRESLPEDISSDAVAEQTHAVAEQTHAVAEQTLLSTEPDISDEKKLPKDNDDLQSPLSTKGEEFTESSITEAENAIEAVLENEVEKGEEKQHTTNTCGATEGKIENLHGNSQKGTEAISDEQMAEITEPVMGTEINLVHEKEIFTGSLCEEETQSSEKALDIQPDGSSLHVNQDKQDESAGDQIVMEKNNLLDKPGESNLHEEQEAEIGQESTKESDGGQNCLATTEPVIKEENANRTVEAHVQTVNTKSIEEQEIFMSQVQERGLDVVSAKEAPEAEENIVEMAKPKFSTDEEQSSKEDKSVMAGEKTCVGKTKDEEEAKSFADEVATKIEEQGAVQKATHNQTRDLNVVLPTEAPGSEESFVDIKTPEFSTDEEQSPKEDESSMAEDNSYDEKTKGDQEAKNFTDEAPMKIEERGTGQKASPKKHNILSGVGSKVKHQLAKVKKAIIGKPGHAKSELAKS